jgi:alternate signal-mediated exported protein
MNKLTKGAIAGAAGIALLLGGAGSFALWNANTTASAGTITSGTLALVSNSTDANGAWSNAKGSIASIATYKAVPGDVLTFTKKVDITAIGDNLDATLAVDSATIKPASSTNAADVALQSAMTTGSNLSVTIASLPTGITAITGTNTFKVTGATQTKTVSVTVTLTFPQGTAGDNTTQNGHVDLSGLGFRITQKAY